MVKKSTVKVNPICTLGTVFKHKTTARLTIDFELSHELDIHDNEYLAETLATLIKDHKIEFMARISRERKNILKITPVKINLDIEGKPNVQCNGNNKQS